MSLTEQLRQAIDDSGLSLNAISKATGTPYAAIHGFVNNDREITLKTADKLVELFGMRLTAAKRPRKDAVATRKPGSKKGG